MAHLKIYQEAIKQQYVSHWDYDYMTSAQIEKAILAGELKSEQGNIVQSLTADPERRGWWTRCAFRVRAALKRWQ